MLLSMVRLHDPAVTPHKLLRLEFQCEEANEMPLVASTHTLWNIQLGGKIVSRIVTRTVLESKTSMLR